jgi:hypothetical protein
MKNTILAIVILIAVISCKRNLSRTEVENQLKSAMTSYLYKGVNNDSSMVKFFVKSVNFYEDKTFYECEFIVYKQYNKHDTTGMMGARISKDFSTVKRKF